MHRPQSALSRKETDMMDKCHSLINQVHDPVEKLRFMCLSQGTHGILGIGRTFRIMEYNGYRQIKHKEFYQGLVDHGLQVTEEEANEMFNRFETDHSGGLNIDEFLVALRPPMPESRIKIIDAAFTKLDSRGDGVLSIEDIRNVYSCTSNSRYQSGEDSKENIMVEFLNNFEKDKNRDGVVTKEEFMNYYVGVSASVDDDCYFDLMMRQAYKL